MQLRKVKAQYIIYHGYSVTQSATAIFFKTAKKVIKNVRILGTHYTCNPVFGALVCGEAYDGYIGVATRPVFDALPRTATAMDNMVNEGLPPNHTLCTYLHLVSIPLISPKLV